VSGGDFILENARNAARGERRAAIASRGQQRPTISVVNFKINTRTRAASVFGRVLVFWDLAHRFAVAAKT
jgi:hypothetical protein